MNGHILPVTKGWPADVACTLNAHFGNKQGLENQHVNGGASLFVPHYIGGIDYENNGHGMDVTGPLLKGSPTGGGRPLPAIVYALAGNTIGRAPENDGNGTGYDESGSSYTLTKTDVHAVAYRTNAAGQVNDQGDVAACINTFTDPTAQFLLQAHGIDGAGHCLRSGASKADKPCSTTYVQQQMRVRRLTPLECERLMGYPDGYTNIPGASNTARYKALGNSMAVNCMRILGERIAMVDRVDALEVWLS